MLFKLLPRISVNVLCSFKTNLQCVFLRGLVNKMYFLTNAVTHRFKEKKNMTAAKSCSVVL